MRDSVRWSWLRAVKLTIASVRSGTKVSKKKIRDVLLEVVLRSNSSKENGVDQKHGYTKHLCRNV